MDFDEFVSNLLTVAFWAIAIFGIMFASVWGVLTPIYLFWRCFRDQMENL